MALAGKFKSFVVIAVGAFAILVMFSYSNFPGIKHPENTQSFLLQENLKLETVQNPHQN